MQEKKIKADNMRLLVEILRCLNILNYFNLHISLTLNSTRYMIPIIKGPGHDYFEKPEVWMVELIQIISRVKTGTFIALGLKTVQSLLMLKAVDKDMAFLAFESNQLCLRYVEKVIKSNNFTNTKIVPFGISNIIHRSGDLEFQFFKERDKDYFNILDDGTILDKEGSYNDTDQITKFYIMENIIPDEVSILKIDVKGYELSLLQGAEKLIMQKRPFLMLKVLYSTFERSTSCLKEKDTIDRFIIENGYRAFKITKHSNKNIKHLELSRLISNQHETADCDYVVIPAESEAQFLKLSTERNYIFET